MHCRHFAPLPTRRDMLPLRQMASAPWRSCLLREPASARAGDAAPASTGRGKARGDRRRRRPATTRPKAKSVIFLYMDGGPSQVDTFDPKPLLEKHGQPIKVQVEPTQFNNVGNVLNRPWKFQQHGESGHPGQRPVPARRQVRRRPGDHPLDGLQLLRAHQRQLLPAHRHRRSRAGPAWARGSATGWAASARTCPASSSSTAA